MAASAGNLASSMKKRWLDTLRDGLGGSGRETKYIVVLLTR